MALLSLDHLVFENVSDRVRFLLVWRLSLWFTGIFAVLTALFFFDASDTFLAYSIAFLIAFSSSIYLHRTGHFKPIFFFYAIAGTIVINGSAIIILDSPHFADFLWILLGVLMTFFGLGMRWGFIFLGINILPIIYFIFFRMDLHFEVLPQQSTLEKIILSLELIACNFIIGYIIYQFVKIKDMAEASLLEKNRILQETNELMHKNAEEKTVLVKEIHHRVKNNLQIIISLLRLQMQDIQNRETEEHFSEAINRVMVMSSIHQKLYRQDEITKFNITDYVLELALELKQFYSEEFPVEINVDSDYKDIDLKTIVPLGLILNELLSNTFKYAFEESNKGEIHIRLVDAKGGFELYYHDNGKWKEDESVNGFGTELIDLLTEQLNGVKNLQKSTEGTTYSFFLQKINDP